MTPEFSRPEFSRMVDLRQITAAPLTLEATQDELAALAARFTLVAVERLTAEVRLVADGDVVNVQGRLSAAWTQPCAVSGEDLAQRVDEPLAFRFVPSSGPQSAEDEIELSEDDCDEIAYSGTSFDLGEAIAQSFGLAIDPFACGPEAERARQEAGIVDEAAAGPFGALAGLKLGKD